MKSEITSDKMLFNLDRLFGEHRPITADVFLSNYCNNACPYCTYRRWELDANARSMSIDDFKKYATRMIDLGIRGFILTGGGEPTVAKDFDAICEWLQANKVHYGINTNFNELKLIAPDYIKVSLDGWDEDSYEASRGVRRYHRVVENIVAYDSWRKSNAPYTTLGVQCVVVDPKQVRLLYDGCKNLPVDYIVLRPIESTNGAHYSENVNFEIAQECIGEIQKLCKEDDRVRLNFKWNMLRSFPGKSCSAHWAQLAVNECGEVMYCCHKPYEIVGHIMDEDILEKHSSAKTNMAKCDVPCRMTCSNLFVNKILSGRSDSMFI